MNMPSLDSREQLAAVIEFASDAILIVDPDARVRSWNPGAERLFGFTFEEIDGRPVSMLLPPSRIASQTYRLLRLLSRGGRVNNYETVGRRKDGRPVEIALSISPMSAGNGSRGACLIVRDVGRRRRAEERRQQQRRRTRVRADVASAFGRAQLDLDAALQACADAVVRHLDVAGARVWLAADSSMDLALRASAGVPPPCRLGGGGPLKNDGPVSARPGSRIAQVAASREPFVSNSLVAEAAGDLGLWFDVRDTTAFAAHPIVVRDQPAGVIALCARRPLRHATLDLLPWLADAIGHGIERVRTKEALRESEARFLAIAESGVASVIIYRNDRILYANALTAELTGFTREELAGMDLFDIVHPHAREAARKRAAARIAGEAVPARFEMPVLAKSGETRWADLSATVVTYQGEKAIVTVGLDVTERKRMEQAVQEREGIVRALAHSEVIAVFVHDGHRLLDVCGATALTGYTRDELLAMPDFFELVHPDFRESARARAAARLRGEPVPVRRESKYVTKTGREVWTDVSAALTTLDGRPAIVLVLIDITERKHAAEQLAAHERFLSTIVESQPDCVKTVSHDGTILQMNRAGLAVLQAERADQVVGRGLVELVVPEHRGACERLLRQVFAGENGFAEFDVVNFAGRRRTFESHGVPLRGGDDRIVAMLAITRDITERKNAEEDLRARGEAERKARLSAEILSDANLQLTRTLDLQDTLEALLDALARVAPYDSAHVIAVEDDFKPLATRGYERWTHPERAQSMMRHLAGSRLKHRMYTSRRGIIIADTRSSSDWRHFDETGYIRSWLGVPLFAGTQLIAMYAMEKAEPGFFTEEHLRMAEALAGPAGVAIQNARLFGQVTAARQRLELLSKRLVEVQEAERRQIARELHDEIGQSMTGLKLTLEAMSRVLPEAREKKLRDAQGLVMDLMTRVRELSLSLRPPVLDDMGLLAGLVALFNRYTAQTHVEVAFSPHDLDRRLPPEIETAAFRVVQEALTNVARHAGVNRVHVRIRVMADSLLGLISDEGAGFDAAEAMRQATGGLSGMKERVALLGGWFWVESSPGKGTRVVIALPLKRPLAT